MSANTTAIESKEDVVKRIEMIEEAIRKLDSRNVELCKEAESLEKVISQETLDIKGLKEDISQVKSELSVESQDKNLVKLKKLVEMKEKIKLADVKFREESREEFEELEERNSNLIIMLEDITSQAPVKDSEVDLATLSKLRCEAARLDDLERSADQVLASVATRQDLIKFQKKFLQLHQQVSAKQVETLNYYDMYNNLGNQKTFLEKEIGLLTSMQDSLSDCRGPQNNKLSYYNKIEDLLSAVVKAQSSCKEKLSQQQKLKSVHDKEKESLATEKEKFSKMVQEVQKILNN